MHYEGPSSAQLTCVVSLMLSFDQPQRRLLSTCSLVVGRACLQPAVEPVAALLTVCLLFRTVLLDAVRCCVQDLSPKYASALLGITNTAGAIPGVLGVTSAGYLLDATNSWQLALFLPTAACQLFGAVFYTIFASSERQHWS